MRTHFLVSRWLLLFFRLGNLYFFLSFFLNYILLIMPLQLSWFSPLLPSTQHPPLPQAIPILISCLQAMHVSSSATPFLILYFISPWLFCTYLFVLLNPLTSSHIPPSPLPIGNHQNTLCIHDSVSVLVCLVYFLKSFVDK